MIADRRHSQISRCPTFSLSPDRRRRSPTVQSFRQHDHVVSLAHSEVCNADKRMPVDSWKCRTMCSDRRIVPLPPKMPGNIYTKAFDGLRKRRAIGL